MTTNTIAVVFLMGIVSGISGTVAAAEADRGQPWIRYAFVCALDAGIGIALIMGYFQ